MATALERVFLTVGYQERGREREREREKEIELLYYFCANYTCVYASIYIHTYIQC